MKVVETVDEFRRAAAAAPRPLGLAPTMGALHEGHRSLLRLARGENATAAASLFVNPTQFGPSEDFSTYPRDRMADLDVLREEGIDLVFAPDAGEMYPPGFDTSVDAGRIAKRLEGERRPTHFLGVATVVCKLFVIARPDYAYFGQKDAQQSMVVERLNSDLNLGVKIVVCPTVREADGLAMSSRNRYLDPAERAAAAVLFRSLELAKALDTDDAREIRRRMRGLIDQEPLAAVDYVSVADRETLDEIDVIDRPALVSVAVRIGNTRLIDNILLNLNG